LHRCSSAVEVADGLCCFTAIVTNQPATLRTFCYNYLRAPPPDVILSIMHNNDGQGAGVGQDPNRSAKARWKKIKADIKRTDCDAGKLRTVFFTAMSQVFEANQKYWCEPEVKQRFQQLCQVVQSTPLSMAQVVEIARANSNCASSGMGAPAFVQSKSYSFRVGHKATAQPGAQSVSASLASVVDSNGNSVSHFDYSSDDGCKYHLHAARSKKLYELEQYEKEPMMAPGPVFLQHPDGLGESDQVNTAIYISNLFPYKIIMTNNFLLSLPSVTTYSSTVGSSLASS
jgi:hypothetical protein